MRPRASVSASDGFPLVREGGVGLVAQEHGGALKAGGTPEGRSKGGLVHAEKRRARVERSDAIDDAMVGYAEKFLALVDERLKQARGKQYRCACGRFGPKVLEVTLRETADLAVKFAEAAKEKGVGTTVMIPFQVTVAAGGPVMPYGLEVPADIAGDEKMKSYLPAVWELVRRVKVLGWVDAVVEVLEAAPQEATADG